MYINNLQIAKYAFKIYVSYILQGFYIKILHTSEKIWQFAVSSGPNCDYYYDTMLMKILDITCLHINSDL